MKTLMGDVTVWRVRACAACLVSPSLIISRLFSPSRLSPLSRLPAAGTATALPGPAPPARSGHRGPASARTHTAESCQCILYTVLTRLTKTEL